MMVIQPGRFAALGSARYWRLYFSGTPMGGNLYIEIFEVELFAAVDATGTDLTSAKTAVASSVYPGLPASYANDDNASTEWSTADGSYTNAWIYFDLSSDFRVRSATITPRVAVSTGHAEITASVLIQYSPDASSWTTLATISPLTPAASRHSPTYNKPPALLKRPVMVERRPRIPSAAKPALTTEQKVVALTRTVDKLPEPTVIWTDARPDSGFGDGAEPEWTATGDGSTVTLALPGRITTSPARYRVTVGGVLQSPAAYSLPDDGEALVFVEAPPAGCAIRVVAPFYGTATG